MPNWVTNEIAAAPSVIAAMLNSEGRKAIKRHP